MWMGATQGPERCWNDRANARSGRSRGFVNFVLFCNCEVDIRRDDRLYSSLVRQEVDVRVRALHVHCDGFQRPVDTDAQSFKDFQTLMNGRNDFLHGNVDPQRLAFDAMFADTFGAEQTIPLFRDDRSFLARYLANALKFVEPQTDTLSHLYR